MSAFQTIDLFAAVRRQLAFAFNPSRTKFPAPRDNDNPVIKMARRLFKENVVLVDGLSFKERGAADVLISGRTVAVDERGGFTYIRPHRLNPLTFLRGQWGWGSGLSRYALGREPDPFQLI